MNKRTLIILAVIVFIFLDILISLIVFFPENPLFNFFSKINISSILPTSQFKSEKLINVTSDTTKFSVSLVNKDKLQSILEKLNFWKPNTVAIFLSISKQEKNLATVKSLNIHLTDQRQPFGDIINTQTQLPYLAYGMKYNHIDSSLTLNLFVDPVKLNSDLSGAYFSYILIYALFDITHPYQHQPPAGIYDFVVKNLNTIPNRALFNIYMKK